MTPTVLLLAAFALLLFALFSAKLESSSITPPMLFTAVGLALGPVGLGLVHLDIAEPSFRLLAEMTLVLVLFTDASRINLRLMRRSYPLPLRLLSLGLPVCWLTGALVAWWLIPNLAFWEAAALAAILAPTDAALGQAVMTNPLVPTRIRQAINVESGLNDGLALPLVLITLSLAASGEGVDPGFNWSMWTLKQVVLGPAAGALVGLSGGWLLSLSQRHGWMTHVFQDLASLSLSFLAYALAHLIGGNGLLAAFVAGLTLGTTARHICTCLWEFAESEGQLLVLISFMIFGAVMAPLALNCADWQLWLYAGLSLTVIRMAPAALSVAGMGLRWSSQAFIGWFGPRGLASILFVLLMLSRFHLDHANTIISAVSLTVLLSIYAHGLSAAPLANLYGRSMERMAKREGAETRPELLAVESEMPIRLPHSSQAHHQPMHPPDQTQD
jgi:NhaP-type Na+/H+ or K+/H+ antiporter